MLAMRMLQRELMATNKIAHDLADDLTDAEWTSRALPGTNVIAFELWHMVRAQDWAVHTIIRGVPETMAESRWHGRLGDFAAVGIGVGLSQAEADALGRALHRQDVLDYGDEVIRRLLSWLSSIDEPTLEAIPDVYAHIAPYPVYHQARETWAPWVFEGVPAWHFLTRACIGHAFGHLTTIEILKQQLRQQADRGADE